MSANATLATAAVLSATNAEKSHRVRLIVAYVLAITFIFAIALYGANYYTLGAADRPFSPKHAALRPSGAIGLKLGFLGFGMFLVIFLYPLRKFWGWLGRQGSARHWLDFHVLLGLSAPFVIAFHSSFKFNGFAGIAFWIMVAVSISGIVGRYVYGQIPRKLNAAEISVRELQDLQTRMAEQIAPQRVLPEVDIRQLLRLPSAERVESLPLVAALVYMIALDLVRPFRVARLRRHALDFGETVSSCLGFRRTRHVALERVIETAREEAALSKRILFLSRSQQLFHLWHVIHKPFSYSFALLALIHIVVVMMMGYM